MIRIVCLSVFLFINPIFNLSIPSDGLIKAYSVDEYIFKQDENMLTICDGRGINCVEFRYNDLHKRFPGVFTTEEDLIRKIQEFENRRHDLLNSQGMTSMTNENALQDDGDSCCPTHISHHINTTLTNIYGVVRPIIHTPPSYQYIPHGSCVQTKTSNCDGRCLIEPLVLSLLTWDFIENTFEFDSFIVNGYCSCKGI